MVKYNVYLYLKICFLSKNVIAFSDGHIKQI